jgi:hypothetical protein
MRKMSGILLLILLGASPQEDLRAKFDAKKASDPVEAFKILGASPGDAAQKIARPAAAKQITQDLAAGLKAYGENKPDLAEMPFSRAALLAEPYCPELSAQLMRMYFSLKQARRTALTCATCKGNGAVSCAACQLGFALGPCPGCEAKGSVACFLCDGSGQLAHHGYKGPFVLTVSDTKVSVGGKSGTLHGQVITYTLDPCAGGSFHLRTSNVITCSHKVPPISFDGSKGCVEFWKEMKMFAFNGRAKMQVNNPKGQLSAISASAARRFFGEYENCAGGKVPCDRCAGKKTDVCSICSGKGQASLVCPKCDGSSLVACAACKGYGDSSWMARALPPAAAPALCQALANEAATLRDWLDERARRSARQRQLTQRFTDAKKDLDPTAKLTDDTVDIVCPKCKGNGRDCEECWNAGRREYTVGTSQFERYAIVQRLERQLKEFDKTAAPIPALPPLPETESGAVADLNKAAPPVVVPPSPAIKIPKDINEMIKKADELYESGKAHLEKSKGSRDNAVWQDEAIKALQDLKNSRILYTTALEAYDALGAPIPKSLLEKNNLNMQALVMARKQAP